MLKSMTDYFIAEKQESLLFIAVGLLALAVAAWLWLDGHRLRSMAYPLVAIALIQLVVGGTVYARTDGQLAQLSQQLSQAPQRFKAEEQQRMATVMQNFRTYKFIEVALLLLGMALIVLLQRHDLAAGIGAGLVLQSAFMLCLDVFAESRGHQYLQALQALPG